jgi:hypothetical protein
VIRAVPESRATFSFNERRLGATGPQITQGIYTGIESGAMLIPVVGPFVAAAAAVANAFGLGKGCGVSCTQATQVVNQIEPVMQQNVAAAQQQATANGGCLMPAEVAVLTQNFQILWQQVLNGCGQLPAPGGTQCIQDRQPGGKYDWTAYYLTPIQQIPVCQVSPPPASSSTEAFPATSTSSPAIAPTSSPSAPVYVAATATTPATIAGIPSTLVYLGIGALALFIVVQK